MLTSVAAPHTTYGESSSGAELPDAERRFGGESPYTVVAALCHDIRTPLGALQASVEVMHDYPTMSPQELASMVERLRRGLVWLEGLVDDLSTWAARQDGALEINRAPVRIGEDVIARSVEIVGPLLLRRAQEASTLNVAPGLWVSGDAVRLTQVMVNLLANASTYGPAGLPIDVAAHQVKGTVEVRVTDRGPGLTAEEQRTIFDRYVRGAAALSAPQHHKGSGLGLHIVREIVQLHEGAAGVDSTPGRGASFWFRLPGLLSCTEESWQRRPA